jgi:uncharacterized phage infection (PIP) family protein YhgE
MTMAELSDMNEEQLLEYANMLEQKGRDIRKGIMKKRERLAEIEESDLTDEEKETVISLLTKTNDTALAARRDVIVTADLVMGIKTETVDLIAKEG